MITFAVTNETVALLLEENELSDVRAAVESRLSMSGFSPWKDMEAELFTYNGRRLLIARPCRPRLCRLGTKSPRLRRI
ncbi:MAG: hypothetical protein ACOX68_01910 [Candidatus Limivicinus sp.]